MAYEFPTENWWTEWKEKVNSVSDFPEVGVDWGNGFNGNFIFKVTSDEELGHTVNIFAEINNGKVHDIYETESPEDEDVGFVYEGPYQEWKKLAQQKMDPIEGIMGGYFEVDGDMSTILKYNTAVVTLAEASSLVDTEW